METTTRAKAGGEYGVNGEFYNGGEFLPSSPYTVKGATKAEVKRITRKQEIAPYCWRVAPNGEQSIWSVIRSIVYFVESTYSKEAGKTGIVAPAVTNWKAMGWTIEGYNGYLQLIEKWNKGERWIK